MTVSAPTPTTSSTGDALLQEVSEAKHGDLLAPVTVLAPTTYAAVALRREMVLSSRRRARPGVANVSCTTLGLIARQLGGAQLAGRGWRVAPPVVEAEVIRATAAGRPEVWARLASHPGTLAAVQRAFVELRRLPPATLEGLARQPVRGAEVVALLVAVRHRLHEHGLADPADLRQAALDVLRSGSALPAELGSLVVVPGAADGPADAELLSALARRVPSRSAPPAARADATERWACSDSAEEARAAVRLVLAGAEDGIPLWRQAILHPPGPGYARLLHQELSAADVPGHGPQLRRLDGTGPGRALLGLLELAGGDWQRPQVLAWLASAPLRTGPEGRPVPVSRWNLLSAEAGVVRGLLQWRTRLERLAGRQPHDAPEALSLADFVEDLARAVPNGRMRWSAWTAWAVEKLARYVDDRPDACWPAEQRSALAQVADVAASLAELDALSTGVDLAGFRRALRAELEHQPLDLADMPTGGVGDGVLVAPFDRARGVAFRSVVLVGMADALVPGRAADDALLPDELRALDASGALRTRAARQEQMRADVEDALAAASERRVVTHPAVDSRTGRVQVPSRFLAMLGSPSLRRVESLAASLRGGGPPLSAGERRLRALDAWVDAGLAPGLSPPARLDPRLGTGLEAVRSRASDAFTRFDGLLRTGQVTPFDPARPVSATRLEVYAECPRKFLFSRVLGIERRRLPEDLWRIEARDRGSLVHAVLEQYVGERVAGAPRSLERLVEIAEEHLDEADAGGIVGKALLWRLDRAAIGRDLHLFFAEEEGLEPLAAELSFGDEDDDAPPLLVRLSGGGEVRFRGRVDRVDRGPGGELVVSDYKTGKQRAIADLKEDPLEGGKRLQLPLYAMAARQALGWDGAIVARYWMVSAERLAARYQLEVTEPVERHFTEVVARIARGVDAGCFPGIPGAQRDTGFDVCLYCDFDVVCPAIRDRQWAAKRARPELAPVADLLDVQVPEPLPGMVVRSVRFGPGPSAPGARSTP